MLKRITLFLFMVFNLNIYSQVVIKDEIVLDETEFREVDEASVSSPFYGRIYFRKYCTNYGRGDKTEVSVGGQSLIFPIACANFACDIGSWCFCVAGYYDEHDFLDMPSGTTVTVSMQYCNGLTWEFIDIPLQFSYAGNDTYNLNAENPEGGGSVNIGYVKFFPQTPPGCDPQFDCVEENFLPEVTMNQVENGYGGIDACESEDKPIGVTYPLFGDFAYNFEFSSCYNKQLQRWWFNLDNNHSFILNYIYEICEENIPQERELIYDWRDFPIDYGCDKILLDLVNQFSYGGGMAHYILQSVVEVHEQAHLNDNLYFINKNKSNLYYNLTNDLKGCNEFNTIEEANNYWQERIELYFAEYKTNVQNDISKYKRSFGDKAKFEQAAHSYLTVQSSIYDQINLALGFYGCD